MSDTTNPVDLIPQQSIQAITTDEKVEENGTMTYGEFDTRCQKRSIERTISAIDAVKDLPEELSRDVKHFIKNNSKCEFWEVKKELTPLNHLLFCSGSLQICDIHYKIDGKKIQFDKGNEFWQDNNFQSKFVNRISKILSLF